MSAVSGMFIGVGGATFIVALLLLKQSLSGYESALKPMLYTVSRRPWQGALVGLVVTSIIQSSSATAAMTVGLVGAGWLSLPQALGIVLGANVGTTVTGQILAFPADNLAMPLFIGGFVVAMGGPVRWRRGAQILAALGGVFFGLWALGRGLLALDPELWMGPFFRGIAGDDLHALVAGAASTAVVQSSSVVIGLLIRLADSGVIPTRAAIVASLGSNIGTVVTTVIAGVSAGKTARKVALVDLLFNVGGVLALWPLMPVFIVAVHTLSTQPGRQVAHAHTLFNVVTVAAALPFVYPIARLVSGKRQD